MSYASFRGSPLFSLALALVSVVACSGKPGADDSPPPASAPTFTRTVVELTPGNPPAIAVVPIALEEQRARVAQGKPDATRSRPLTSPCVDAGAAGVVVDTSCPGADLWLFDRADRTGNELCVRSKNTCSLPNGGGTPGGSVDLSTIGRECTYLPPHGVVCFSNWSGAVRSFYAGYESGTFYSESPAWERFKAWQEEATASPAVQEANTVVLNGAP